MPYHTCCSGSVSCSAFSTAQCHSFTSSRAEQEDDCSLQPLHGPTPPQSQAHKAKEEEEELAGCIAANTTNTEYTSGRKAFPDHYLMCTARTVGSPVGTGLEKQRQGPDSYHVFCHLQTPGPLQPVCPYIIILQAPFVVLSLCDIPDGLEPSHVKLGRKV